MSPFLSCPRSGITVSPQPAKSHSLQTIHFQHNTHSFPQRRQPIPRPFNHLRLPAVEGTLLPLTASFFSSSYSAPSMSPSFCRFLFSFQELAASLLSPKKSTPLESNKYSLFLQNARGVGRGLRVRSPLVYPERFLRRVTRHSPLVTRHFPMSARFSFSPPACYRPPRKHVGGTHVR